MKWFVVGAALLPAIILLLIIWLRDNVKREPMWLIILAFLAGTLAAPLSMVVSYPALTLWHEHMGPWVSVTLTAWYEAFCCAAIPEELAKFAILWLFLVKNKWFDEYMDGIVYASAIGLGFAGLENVLYLIQSEDWVMLGTVRALLSVPLHFGCGIMMGYFYALWRMEHTRRNLWLCLLVPIVFHGCYDFALMWFPYSGGLSVFLTVAFVLLLFGLRRQCKRSIAKHIARDQFQNFLASRGGS